MSLLEEDFDVDYDIGNADGVEFGDIFYLNYYGVNVFFYVCGLDRHRVRVYELAKKRSVIDGVSAEYLTPDFKPTSAPKVVLTHNSWTKSEYWVKTTPDGRLEFYIGFGPLMCKAMKVSEQYPVSGYVYAFSLKKEQEVGILKYYWEAPKPVKKQKRNKIKISA